MPSQTQPVHHPLRRLFGYAHKHRRDVWLGTFYSVANKFFDVGAVFFALTWKLAALALIPVPFIHQKAP